MCGLAVCGLAPGIGEAYTCDGAVCKVQLEVADRCDRRSNRQGYRIISHVLLTSIYHVADKA